MISFKDDDDDDEEEEDIFVQPLTKPLTAESLDDEYFNLPINEKKPTMAVRFDWEDQRRRCYLTNIMEKYQMKLVRSSIDFYSIYNCETMLIRYAQNRTPN